jgi:glycerophosphoryl diester phosphodiesterase
MEGIYTLTAGDQGLGQEFVCLVSKDKLSFFSNKDGIYLILRYGFNPLDSSIRFSGFWRYSESTEQGLIEFTVQDVRGATTLMTTGLVDKLELTGKFSAGQASPQLFNLKYNRPFSDYTKQHEFMIFAHHGVQTDDDPPYTENSLGGVTHDEDYGVNGLEFDVHLTHDHIPICVHDADIETRVTKKGPISGDYDQFDYEILDSLVRLTDDEKVPSVEEVLNDFIDSTTMHYMWLDIKGDPGIFEYLEPVVRNAYARAAKQKRDIIIISDLTSDEVVAEYKAWPAYDSLPTLCEISLDAAINNHCQYWGPRYTLGLLTDQVQQAHSLGIKVLSWTLDDKTLIHDYLVNGQFDGFISDYPAYVVYDYYTLF